MTETWRTGSRCPHGVEKFPDFLPFNYVIPADFYCFCRPCDHFQARNRSGQVGYVPEKYLQLPSSNSLLSMLQALAALDARSHSSSNSTEPETELQTGSINGDASGEETSNLPTCPFIVPPSF